MNRLEAYFLWHGRQVARFPKTVIVISLIVTILCGLGLFRFYEESDMTALWVPKGSRYRNNFDWVQEHFPRQIRINQAIFKATNVLEPKVLKEINKLRHKIYDIHHNGYKWKDICLKVPVIKKPDCFDPSKISWTDLLYGRKRKKRNVEKTKNDDSKCENPDAAKLFKDYSFGEIFSLKSKIDTEGFTTDLAKELSLSFYPEPYCTFTKSLPSICYEESLLELWADDGILDDQEVDILKLSDVIEKVNNHNMSGLFMVEKNFSKMLEDISYNETGHIVGAGVTTLTWVGKINQTSLDLFGSAQRLEIVDQVTFDFEGEMIEVTTNKTDLHEDVETSIIVARMFFEAIINQFFDDAGMLLVGYMIVFFYVFLMLGKFSWVQQRVWLSFGGILGVVMGIIASYGICSLFGFFYSVVHTLIPFLLLGVGIDNIFVIVQRRNTLTDKEKELPVVDRLSLTLGHAGVSITVTSLTNFIAFGIGATTSLPVLQSFCMYSAIGILVIFIFQTTWFVALLALDEARQDAKRDGCLCCIQHPNSREDKTTSSRRITEIFNKISQYIITVPVKVVILLLTLILLGVGIFGMINLVLEVKLEWFIDPESELFSWFEDHNKYFGSDGEQGNIFIKPIVYPDNFENLDALVDNLEDEIEVIRSVDSWHVKFKEFMLRDNPEFTWSIMDQTSFQDKLSQFLFSPFGAKYQNMFKFNGSLQCGHPAPVILSSIIEYRHVHFDSASKWVPALDQMNSLVSSSNISWTVDDSAVIAVTDRYANWETDKVIQVEFYKNVGLSLLAIFFTILVFLRSITSAILVIFCVTATIVEVAGFMHFWGLTIDFVTCNSLIISIGLCVDFCAHIAHGFLTSTGTRNERVTETMTKIGPAVLNGGFSTVLALLLLSTSKSYIFLSFFKIFFMICLLGLYHGLIALPVLLSLFGPESQGMEEKKDDNETEEIQPLREENPVAEESLNEEPKRNIHWIDA